MREINVGAGAASKAGFFGITPTVERAGAYQVAVTYASQTPGGPPTQAQVHTLNDGLVGHRHAGGRTPRRRG